MSGVAASRAFLEPLALVEASAAMAFRTPLGESGAVAETRPLRAPLEESVGAGVGLFLTPLGESPDVATAFCTRLGESAAAAVGAFRTPLESADVGVALFCPPAPETRGAEPAALPARLAESMEVARPGALAATGLPLWAVEAGRAGGIPKPAGEAGFSVPVAGSAFAGAVALTGAACEGDLGGLTAPDRPAAGPCAGFTSLAAEAALEVLPSPGSSVSSN